MYGIYANIGGILMVNVTIYTIHGSYGYLIISPMSVFQSGFAYFLGGKTAETLSSGHSTDSTETSQISVDKPGIPGLLVGYE